MKIDCSNTENYFKEKARMVKFDFTSVCCSINCKDCSLDNQDDTLTCAELEYNHPDKAVALVQKWSDENPQKTYKEDFFEKFPHEVKTSDNYPEVIPCQVYLKLKNDRSYGCVNKFCKDCWNKVMEE